MIQANTIASEIIDELLPFLETGKQYSANDSDILKLEAKAKTLSKVDIRDGYILLATCSMLRARYAEMRDRYKTATDQGLDAGKKLNYVICLTHAGFYLEASEILKSSAMSLPDPVFAAHKALMSYQFTLALELYEKALKMQLKPQNDTTFYAIPALQKKAVNGQITDHQTALLSELAGEVMRKNNVYHKGEADLTTFPRDDGQGDVIVATLNVPTSYDIASEMNFSFAEMLVSKGWDDSNFIIRFCGDSSE